jgi:hypothetical protein
LHSGFFTNLIDGSNADAPDGGENQDVPDAEEGEEVQGGVHSLRSFLLVIQSWMATMIAIEMANPPKRRKR